MNEQSLFIEALEMHDPAEQAAFLDQMCAGNPVLRQRLERLLQRHQQADSFLESPASVWATVEGLIEERPGTVIGPYKLMEQVGEGGMGLVFVAEQQQPIRRKVALKVIKPGMDTRQVVARFEAERQALALMDHPNIAKVLDGGTTASSRPYFVMELVRGVPITDYCDQDQVPIRQRLELFISVCQAVQHAHQKGIIHRDLKPSNVLVVSHDATPVVKVIDFGVAKAIGQQLTDKSIYTRLSQMVGTPLYMSPEQAGQSGLDVDTRSDIYSLGVLLYELLAGITPFDQERLREVGDDEMRRIIREEEPPKPSTRISTMGKAATTVSTLRQSEPKQLSRLLRGDLDWIVMKCLEKDRSRRYDSASGLARDLERYLAGEPVLARPPSTSYRLGKFVQRHRVGVLAGVGVAAALVVGTVVAAWQAVVATQAKQTALAKEAETRAVLDFVETKVFAAARPKGQQGGLGTSTTIRQAVEAALPFVANRFTEQPLTEARLRMTLGKSFQYLGECKIAAEQFQIARALYSQHRGLEDPDTLDSMDWLAESYRYMDQCAEALQLQEETLALRKTHLGPDHRDTLRSMNNLAICYWTLGRTAETLQLHEETLARRQAQLGMDDRETLESMNNLAETYNALGRHDDALSLHQETLALMKTNMGSDHPDTLMSMSNVGETLLALGRYAGAVGPLEETLMRRKDQLGRDHQEALQSMSILATCYRCLGRHDEALQLIEDALAAQKEKLGSDHSDTLQSMHNLACIRFARGDHPEALKLYEETLDRRKSKIGAGHQDVLKSIREMAGLRLLHFEKTKDAAGCRAMAEMCEKLQLTDPAGCYDVARYRAVTGAVLRAGGKPAEAKQADVEADRAMAWLNKAVAVGYKDVAKLNQDKTLDSLRDREDFRKLVAELEAGKPRESK
jgi:serine/threonine protein kinase/tetratricopeptide (TPR) repeat protein